MVNLFPTYDAAAMNEYYDARPVEAISRLLRVAVPYSAWIIQTRYLDKYIYKFGTIPTEKRAEQLRKLLTWAGPTYIKYGQAIGNRPDVVGLVYSKSLQKLVDNVGTFDIEVALEIVRRELGISDIHDVFAEFDTTAVASASLGQVHKARLHTGEQVAVKIQRPEAPITAPIDLYVLRKGAAFAKRRFKLRSDLVGAVNEFGTRLWEELDYVNEADNMDKFRKLYAESNPDIYVPHVHRKYTTSRVLTMEWIDGDKPPWFPQDDALRLINIGVQCSLRQLLQEGMLHADPHVGNLMRHKASNQLVYLDFGMCITLSEQVRYSLIAAIVRLINRDYENLADDFVTLGFLPEDTDTKPLVPLLEKAFGDASEGEGVSNLSFGKLTSNLTELATTTPIRIPVFFTLVIRSLTILEGIALQTDPDFKIVDQSYPFVVQRVLEDDSDILLEALQNVLIDQKTRRVRWDRLQSIASGLSNGNGSGKKDKGAPVTTPAEDTDSFISSTAMTRLLDFTLSDRGMFFRNALTLELSDTVDAVQLALAHRTSQLTGGLFPKPTDNFDSERVQVAMRIIDAIRRRGPDLLGKSDTPQAKERREKMSQVLNQTVRVVLADISDRNTRRFLRKLMKAILGEKD